MNINKFLLGIILLICPQLKSEMCGYTRVFEPDTQTTIDILYDLHHSHPKKQLFSSEAKLDQILSTLNECNENVDLVWEYNESTNFQLLQQGAMAFISAYPMHIAENFTNLNLIAADRCRRSGYAGLFKWDSPFLRYTNTEGSTFEEPVPFGLERRSQMIERTRKTVYDNYVKLYAQTVAELTSHFSDAYRNSLPIGERDIKSTEAFDKIADLEMLYHILVSDKKRIIVYCGAWHADNIAVFLVKNGYVPLKYKPRSPREEEPTLAELEFLYGDGRALWALKKSVPIAPTLSALPTRAAAASASERAVAKPEEKRSLLAARLMADLPDPRALAQVYKSSISKSSAIKEECSLQSYRMALGTFEIYFDGDATFDRTCVAEILKDALEDVMKHVLKLQGSSLSLPFLYLDSDERNISAVYDTSTQLQQLVTQIERSFRESAAVRAFIAEGRIRAIENKSSTDLPVVCVAELTAGARAHLDTSASSTVPPFTITKSFKAVAQMQWSEVPS